MESLPESRIRWRTILFTICVLILICVFCLLQYTAEHYYQIKGFTLIAFDIFVVIALAALGVIGWCYSMLQVYVLKRIQKKKQTGYKEWILERERDTMFQQARLIRGYAIMTVLMALFWSVACLIAQNDIGLALFFAIISLISGTQLQGRLPTYCVYVVSLPIILMFLGSWCHFDDLLPVGIGLFFVNILAIIVYHHFISKYL